SWISTQRCLTNTGNWTGKHKFSVMAVSSVPWRISWMKLMKYQI
ncbi:hypothetical protein CMV_023691, partial [Castanea mollissima]